jgi:hypothetical protein
MAVLKLIKKKSFEAKGEQHVHYTAAYKGRVFGVSTLRFSDNEITENDNGTISISGDIEVLKNASTDPLTGETKTYLDIVPKSGLVLADF